MFKSLIATSTVVVVLALSGCQAAGGPGRSPNSMNPACGYANSPGVNKYDVQRMQTYTGDYYACSGVQRTIVSPPLAL